MWRLVFVLTGLHLLAQISHWGFGHDSVFGLVPMFDLNGELNVPTLYASVSLLFCGALMAVIARVQKLRAAPYAAHWASLASIMAFLALDEFASLHERLSDPIRSALGTSGMFTSAWVIPYGILGLLLGLTFLRFTLALPKSVRTFLVLGGLTFVLGAVGIEMAAGSAKEAAGGSSSLAIAVWTTLEEVLEMSGVVIAVHGLMLLLATTPGGVELHLNEPEAGSQDGVEGSARARHVARPRLELEP